tara:strand:+ start:377 stop:1444 length:1068 start_codon:yes stop_codon:yes gene_type:complete
MHYSVIKILRSYTHTGSIKGFLAKLFIVFSKYECFHSDSLETDNILLFIGFERIFRGDHFDQLRLINNTLNRKNRRASLICYKRKFTCLYLWSFFELRCVAALALKQMEDALCDLRLQNYTKCLVHCDIVPLQAFMVKACNNICVDTFTLQHGFYPNPNSSQQWLTEYRCSESRNFFAWDEKTISFFESVGNNKIFLRAGPFLTPDQVILPQSLEPPRSIFFLPAKSDVEQINFITRLGKLYDSQGVEVVYICHPNFSWLTKTYLSRKYGIVIKYPSFKKSLKENDICFVLNSSVWVELELNFFKVIMLDTYFINDQIFWIDFDLLKEHENIYARQPFMFGPEAINTIIQRLLDD